MPPRQRIQATQLGRSGGKACRVISTPMQVSVSPYPEWTCCGRMFQPHQDLSDSPAGPTRMRHVSTTARVVATHYTHSSGTLPGSTLLAALKATSCLPQPAHEGARTNAGVWLRCGGSEFAIAHYTAVHLHEHNDPKQHCNCKDPTTGKPIAHSKTMKVIAISRQRPQWNELEQLWANNRRDSHHPVLGGNHFLSS
jgi:hypothetical protein